MARPAEQRAVRSHNWSLLGRCFLWCLLCCITRDVHKVRFTEDYYAIRTVLGVPICEKRLRIAARTLSSVI